MAFDTADHNTFMNIGDNHWGNTELTMDYDELYRDFLFLENFDNYAIDSVGSGHDHESKESRSDHHHGFFGADLHFDNHSISSSGFSSPLPSPRSLHLEPMDKSNTALRHTHVATKANDAIFPKWVEQQGGVLSTITSKRARPSRTIVCKSMPPKSDRVKGVVYQIGKLRKRWDGRQWRRICRVVDCCSAAKGKADFCIVHGRGKLEEAIVNGERVYVIKSATSSSQTAAYSDFSTLLGHHAAPSYPRGKKRKATRKHG